MPKKYLIGCFSGREPATPPHVESEAPGLHVRRRTGPIVVRSLVDRLPGTPQWRPQLSRSTNVSLAAKSLCFRPANGSKRGSANGCNLGLDKLEAIVGRVKKHLQPICGIEPIPIVINRSPRRGWTGIAAIDNWHRKTYAFAEMQRACIISKDAHDTRRYLPRPLLSGSAPPSIKHQLRVDWRISARFFIDPGRFHMTICS